MEEVISHQLGMAMALCSLGAETISEHKALLAKCLDAGELIKAIRMFEDHAKRSEEIAEAEGLTVKAQEACETAGETFRLMRTDFFAAMGKDITHILAWMAMSSASGIAIWSTLEGAADSSGNLELENLANEALGFQKDLLEKSEKALHDLARASRLSGAVPF